MRDVIIIHADQHRCDCLGAYGNRDVQTPHLDALARDGVIHTNHFCVFPVCTPSRYALLTGRYSSSHTGSSNYSTLPAGIETFASVLRKNGCRTAAVGKMHFTPTYLDAGFDHLVLAEQDGPGRFDDDYHRHLKNLGLLDRIDLVDQRREYRQNAPAEYFENFGAKVSDLPREHHSTTYITNRALEQISQFQEHGNLLMAGYIKPHHPFDPPAPFDTLYDPEKLTLLDGGPGELSPEDEAKSPGYFPHKNLTEKTLRRVMAHYYGTITHIDEGVGEIVSALKRAGRYDESLILYTSDHGDYMGFHHLLLKGGFMYDPLVRIPLIVKYPASWNKRGTDDRLSSNLCVAGTILAACGLPLPHGMRDHNLADGAKEMEAVFAEYNGGGRRDIMVRTKTHKLLMSGSPASERLFDLRADPFETRDTSKDPNQTPVLQHLKHLALEELVLNKPAYVHLDHAAPTVGAMTRQEQEANRREMMDYMAGMMK